MEHINAKFFSKFNAEIASYYNVSFCHFKYGNLASPHAVVIEKGLFDHKLELDSSLIIHVTITGRCNARCRGCINVSLTCENRLEALEIFEAEPEREAKGIIQLANEYPKRPVTIVFYGGEPLLAPQKIIKIKEILEKSPIASRLRFMLITNGMLVANAWENYPEIVKDFWLYSFSIDGRKEQHEAVRIGTNLDIIHRNISLLKENSKAQVLIWSTLREEQSLADCFQGFMDLYENGLADYFFYHFAETDKPFLDFSGYISRYEKEFSQILDAYLNYLSEGKILPIIHLNELIAFLLTGTRRGHTACGVERAENFDLVGGKILACADLPLEFAIGEIKDSGELEIKTEALPELVNYKEALGCHFCGIEPYCGGRCPVQVLTGSLERTLAYCQLLRLHVALVLEKIPLIKKYLKKWKLYPQDLYDSSGFLARYTDVIP